MGQDKLKEAIKMVKENSMMLGKASRHLDIPKTTINDRLDGFSA
jgi:helix-turn-helix, Psq domain